MGAAAGSLLRLDLGVGGDPLPFLCFGCLEFSELVRRARFRLDAGGQQLFGYLPVGKRFAECRIKLVDDGLGRFCGA